MEAQQTNPGKKVTDQRDHLLKLIEEGDADRILSENDMQKSFSELVKHELIVIKEDKIFLTELGEVARIRGVQKVITDQKAKKVVINTATPVIEKRRIIGSNLPYYILLLLGLLMMLSIQILWE